MTSSHKLIGTLTNSDNSASAPYGGLSLQWMQETGTIDPKQAKTHLVTLHAKKGAILVPVSNELLANGVTVDRQLSEALIQSVSWDMDAAFLNGSGVGQPLGCLKSPSLVVVAKEVGQLADTINYTNIVRCYSALHPSCVANAVWVANSTTLPQLLTMNAAKGAMSFIPAVVQNGGAFSLLGRPLFLTEKLPVLGDQGDLLLVDFSKYAVSLRREVTIDSDRGIGSGFSTDQTNLRAIVRVDGIPLWPKTVTPLHGTTQSWAVVLAERA